MSPQKLVSHMEQLGPTTFGRQSHVPCSGWQRSLLEPTVLHEQPVATRREKEEVLLRENIYNNYTHTPTQVSFISPEFDPFRVITVLALIVIILPSSRR